MKAYKKPETAVVPLQTRTMLSSSPDPDNVINPGEPNVPAGAPEHHTVWDEEW